MTVKSAVKPEGDLALLTYTFLNDFNDEELKSVPGPGNATLAFPRGFTARAVNALNYLYGNKQLLRLINMHYQSYLGIMMASRTDYVVKW